ncbi:MAG: Transmembrane component CbrV of energizing module of predicted cobalamin ECF transporter [uncultured Nocardioidaceae bacterium]|uniref:Transmembrane component CbrV of energizing module of predicted cobalamin ECF transporter n=1 Tax=uncultured Nocardioidaceae bacterium TaxID=253824 RepID=A0A6J4NA34_9ACTN|nr:MAG: Transmembrane component CbrV of energizing module of predicted cobalamin ECF transporter [uncultured Nocardioidaceae bacterium]
MSGAGWAAHRLPRGLHPLAWWLWALGLAVAASRTSNPLLLGAIFAVAVWVVLARRTDGPWARAFRFYLIAAALVVTLRVLFRVLFAGGGTGTVLLHLPRVPLPAGTGISLLGDVTLDAVLGGFYDGLRLATMLVCLGAANALANPRRLLRSMPPALHEVSTAVVVALSVFPQLAESLVRVRRARRLRPHPDSGRVRALLGVVVPVLEDALDRSLLLAASMDSRGYGRRGGRSSAAVATTGALLVAGLCGICVGVYALLDATTPRFLAGPVLLAGVVVGLLGLGLAGRGVQRTAYRPDRWRLPELLVVACGVAVAVVMWQEARIDPSVAYPSVSPPVWPQLPPSALIGVLVGLLPAWLAPPPESLGEAVTAQPTRRRLQEALS